MSDLIQFECPTCQKPLRAKAHVAGKVLECPKCKTPVRVPDAQEAFERLEKDRWLERRTFSTMPFRKTRLIAPVWLSIGAWFITLALTITILLITDAHISDRAAFPLVLGLPAIPYIALRIWFLIEMYKVWKRVIVWLKADALPIPVDTAGQAVGFLFIPFFNFWWARRFYGVGAYLNQIIDREKTGTPLAAEDLGNYLSLSGLLGIISIAVGICFPPAFFLLLLAMLLFEISVIVLAHNLEKSFNRAGQALASRAAS